MRNTLLFEAWVIELAKHLPVDVIAKMVGEHDTRFWRFLKKYTEEQVFSMTDQA